MKKLILIVTVVLFFTQCEKNVVNEHDMVNFEINDLQGKYLVNYIMFKSLGQNYDLSTLVTRTDTFELKILADSNKLTWRNLSSNKSLQFDASTKYIPFKLKQYKQVTIQMWSENTFYKGSINTNNVAWKVYPFVKPYIDGDKDHTWCGFIKDIDGKMKLTGSSVDINQGQYHLRTAPAPDYNNGPEWHFVFKSGDKVN
ncbi:MAG: hypothetical protein H0U95_00195 [Bacteroidetes bacterium]|nr:hypothetical protein [Bacteroidota bacterium]